MNRVQRIRDREVFKLDLTVFDVIYLFNCHRVFYKPDSQWRRNLFLKIVTCEVLRTKLYATSCGIVVNVPAKGYRPHLSAERNTLININTRQREKSLIRERISNVLKFTRIIWLLPLKIFPKTRFPYTFLIINGVKND